MKMRRITHAAGALIGLVGRTAALWNRPSRGLSVLEYHAVGTEIPFPHYGISLSPSAWLQQLEVLQETATVPLLRDGALSTDGTAVTFDDGYRDAVTLVAPELVRRGIPATFFVTCDFILAGAPTYMDVQQLKELAAMPGISIGSHGVTHRRLIECSDAELERELVESRARIEEWIDRPVLAIAYPHGAVDRRVADAARSAGYIAGCTTRFGKNSPDRDPLLLCRREIIARDSLRNFREKLRGDWDWYGMRHPDPAR